MVDEPGRTVARDDRLFVISWWFRLDSTSVSGPHTLVSLGGTFGLAAGRTGEVRYLAVVDSLAAVNQSQMERRVCNEAIQVRVRKIFDQNCRSQFFGN